MISATMAERLARRSATITAFALAVLALAAWLYLVTGAGMKPMATMGGMRPAPWPLVALMWLAMMVAMMLPSAAPMVLLYGRVHRSSRSLAGAPPTAAFLAGYLACWAGFSLLAALLQTHLEAGAAASAATMALASRPAKGALLIAAGAYQLSPIKDACLAQCRSPASFLTRNYRPGAAGAARLGLLHGAYCVGCCWMLMALLFVGGVMNLAWIAALTLLVGVEKLLPRGEWVARGAGAVLIAWGCWLLIP